MEGSLPRYFYINLLGKYKDREIDDVPIAVIVADKMTSEDLKEVCALPSYLLTSTKAYKDVKCDDQLTLD